VKVELRKKPNSACADIVIDDTVIIGEVEFMNFPPVDQGAGDAWRWRDAYGGWGNAATQDDAVSVVVERYQARPETR
jgi:hypothetical protein